MLTVSSFSDVVGAVYGKRWEKFSTSKQEDIIRMIDYWRRNGAITIGRTITPEDVLSAIDKSFGECCSTSVEQVLNGPRSKRNCDMRIIMYKILADRGNSSPSDINLLLNKRRTRPAIYFALEKFDSYYKYDGIFHSLYDDILKTTDKYLYGNA